jgi:hypothetical protein
MLQIIMNKHVSCRGVLDPAAAEGCCLQELLVQRVLQSNLTSSTSQQLT